MNIPSATTQAFQEGNDGTNRDRNELMNTVADLQYAKQKLTEQNQSLQKAMEMSDEANLQLTEELAKLKIQLTSSQQTVRSVRSMAEELEDVKTAVREAQAKAYHMQTCCKELKKENESLIAKMCLLCEENEKAVRGKRQLKYRVDELLTVNAELTKQVHEAQNLLISKEALIFEKTILNEELKVCISESSRVIEGLRTELKRSQGKICQDFFTCKIGLGKSSAGISNVFPVWPWNSLQSEIQTVQVESVEELSSPVCGLLLSEEQGDLFQQTLNHIKVERNSMLFQTTIEEMVNQLNMQAAAFMTSLQRMDSAHSGREQPTAISLKELKKEHKQLMLSVVQKLHRLSTIKDSWDKTIAKLEQACLQCHQQYLKAKYNLTNITKELELQKMLKVEAENKAADAQHRAEEAKEILRTSHDQQARKSMKNMKEVKNEADILVMEESVEVSGWVVPCSECASLEARQICVEAEEREKRVEESTAAAPEEAEGRAQPEGDGADEAERPTAWGLAEEGRKVDEVLIEEMERVKEEAGQNLLETSGKVTEMEHKEAGMERMVSAPHCTASRDRSTAGASDKSLLGKVAISESGKKTPVGNVGEGKESMGGGPFPVALTQGSTERIVETLREAISTTHKWDPPLTHSSLQSEGNITDGRAEPRQPEGVGGERNDNSKVKKPETDVLPSPQESFGRALEVQVGQSLDIGHSIQQALLLDGFTLEPSGTHQPSGGQGDLRPLSLGHEVTAVRSCPEENHTQIPNRNNSSASSSESQSKERGSEGFNPIASNAQPREPLASDKLPEEEESTLGPLLRSLLTSLPSLQISSFSPLGGSRAQSPHCITSPAMPTLPEEEEEGGEGRGTSEQSPLTGITAVEARTSSTPTIILPETAITTIPEFDPSTLLRSHSPVQSRSSRNSRVSSSSASSLTSVADGDGHVYDLLNDELPDVDLSDEDKKKNTELLEEAKKASERFLSRRSRRSRTGMSESPTALTPSISPRTSLDTSQSNSMAAQHQTGSEASAVNGTGVSLPVGQVGEKPLLSPNRDQDMKKHLRKLSPARSVHEARGLPPAVKVSLPTKLVPLDHREIPRLIPAAHIDPTPLKNTSDRLRTNLGQDANVTADLPSSSPVQQKAVVVECKVPQAAQTLSRSKTPCKAEIKSFSSQPPLLRAVSWECVEFDDGPPSPPEMTKEAFAFGEVSAGGCPASPTSSGPSPQPDGKLQKLAKLREENKLMRNQNLSGLRLPDLSESAEQEKGPSPAPGTSANKESKGATDIMPNIPDSLLRKLKVHRTLPGGVPPLTEKEVENTFIQLSLAFKNDSYTLEARLHLAERERNLTEDNTEKELENFSADLKSSTNLWQRPDHRDAYQRLLETISVLHRLAERLSSRAEMVGAVRQEKRMSKATEVMMQYVENLKRTYEKDHAELTEYKKLANQNSNRTYGSYGENGDDGIPRTARSMSLTLGKTVPRRRVSVAVVPKFINFPGHPPSTSGPPATLTMPESTKPPATSTTTSSPSNTGPSSPVSPSNPSLPISRLGVQCGPPLTPLVENGKHNGAGTSSSHTAAQGQPKLDEISKSETKAKIEEEAYNKGYQEGLKAQLKKELKELPEEEEDEEGKGEEASVDEIPEPSLKEERKSSKLEEVSDLVDRLCPKCLKHRNMVWILAVAVVLLAVVISIFTSLRYPCDDPTNPSNGKSTCSAVQQYLWPYSGTRHKNRAPV